MQSKLAFLGFVDVAEVNIEMFGAFDSPNQQGNVCQHGQKHEADENRPSIGSTQYPVESTNIRYENADHDRELDENAA